MINQRILLLSAFAICTAIANTTLSYTPEEAKQSQTKSRAELLDETRAALRKCREQNPIVRDFSIGGYAPFGCHELEKTFNAAKDNFLAPFEPLEKEGIEAGRTYSNIMHSKSNKLPFLGEFNKKNANEYELPKILLGVGASAIFEATTNSNSNRFLCDSRSTQEICEMAILRSVHNKTQTQGTYATDKIGNSCTLEATPEQVIDARKTLMKIVQS